MTGKEKKDIDSEITPQEPQYLGGKLLDLCIQIQYCVIRGGDAQHYCSPLNGFAHIFIAEGCSSGAYTLDERPYIIRCGENAVHPVQQGAIFQWLNGMDETVAVLLFVPENQLFELNAPLDHNQQHGLIFKNTQQLSFTINQLCDLSGQVGPLNKLRLQILLLETLACQLQGLYNEDEEPAGNSNKAYYEKVQSVKKIIESDLSKNYTISELAKRVGTNEQYIKKYFKQYFGKTVLNYSTSTKMEYAKKLIMTGEYRIADVAQMTGYKHSTHFTSAFKRYFGFIPNSLRYTFLIIPGATQLLLDSTLCNIGLYNIV